MVSSISAETVRRILKHHQLKPWRYKMWLSAKVPRDESFAEQLQCISELYTRPLLASEMVVCLDELTNLQPRPRKAATRATQPGRPTQLEHEYLRAGALNLFAAFDTRSGQVYACTAERKRQLELITFLEQLDREIPEPITIIHVVLDNVPMHKGKLVRGWLEVHPRFIFHHPPVHCSWMNQVEQWFGIVKRKRLRILDFSSKVALEAHLLAFVRQWNEHAHPFNWTTKSVTKVMAKCSRVEDQPFELAA